MRITFDSNIEYKNLKISSSINYLDPERVVEIKTSTNCGEDFIEKYIHIPHQDFQNIQEEYYFLNDNSLNFDDHIYIYCNVDTI